MEILGKLVKIVEQEMLDRLYPNGDRYYGQSKDGKPHGMGVIVYANGDKYTGSFKEGNAHGKGRINYYENGNSYEGFWDNNLKHEYGTYVNTKVGKYIGEWELNKITGRGVFEYKNGDYYAGEFRNNLYHGKGTLIFANGAKYIGDFKFGEYHGLGTEIFGPFHLYIGEYKEGKRQGVGFALTEDTSCYFGEFNNGIYDGRGIGIESHNNVYQGEFRNGKYCGEGRYVELFAGEFERESIGIFEENNLNGFVRSFYKDGSDLSGKYKNNICNGNVTKRFPNGESRKRWMAENNFSMDFQGFLRSEAQDIKGRYLLDIWDFSDEQIEFTHDFISLLFPLDSQSNNSSQYFYLDNEELIKVMRADIVVKTNLIKSAEWFLGYLKRNHAWQSKFNHNQFRITRIIRSLRLLVSDREADKFYKNVLDLLDQDHIVNEKSLAFWAGA